MKKTHQKKQSASGCILPVLFFLCFILYIASSNMEFFPIDISFTEKELQEEYPMLLQTDRRWKEEPYGNSSMEISGCGPTCLSMVILMQTEHTSFTPDRVAAYANKRGYYQTGVGTSWNFFTEGARHFDLYGREISPGQTRILNHLKQGHPIICSMGPGTFTDTGHFILLAGEKNGKIIVRDPNSRARSAKLWDYYDIESEVRNMWVYTD